jgi:ABC-type nitrate/sulfonate/bicarbonate transport system permease component
MPDIGYALLRLALSGELWTNIETSLIRVLIGFSIAALSGISLGVLIYEYKPIEIAITPVVDAVRPIAALTIFPLIILLFGLGLSSKVFVIFWTAWPACLLNTVQALRTVDVSVIEAGSLDGAGRFSLLRHIALPLASPTVLTGLRIGLSGGWISLVAAEMLGASSGLGFAVLNYSNSFRFPEMFASIFTIAFLGLLMNLGLAKIQSVLEGDFNVTQSKFIRYGDRSAGWNIDSLFSAKKGGD